MNFDAALLMAIHLRREHNYTWKRLRSMFPGYGNHFWEAAKAGAKE